jgi:hypothetical protein
MSAIAAVTLTDATPVTPVGRVFIPVDCTPQLATWKNLSSGIAIGQDTFTLSVSETSLNINVTAKLVTPVLETVSGDVGGYAPTPKVAYEPFATIKYVLPRRSTLQQRKDLKAMLIDLISESVMTVAVEDHNKPF